jgi:hypothetical protein
MITGGKDIREIKRFLVWDAVGDGKKIDIAFGHASIFCLSAGPAPCKVRITEKPSISLVLAGVQRRDTGGYDSGYGMEYM